MHCLLTLPARKSCKVWIPQYVLGFGLCVVTLQVSYVRESTTCTTTVSVYSHEQRKQAFMIAATVVVAKCSNKKHSIIASLEIVAFSAEKVFSSN